MSFWTYMLHCNGGYFYTGHADDLHRRMAEHESGLIPGFVADYWPAKLVWSQEFLTRLEALEAERRIKGWSRAKKLALIRGDWATISVLAQKKGSPSTSSGRTGEGIIEPCQPFGLNLSKPCPSYRLSCHPDTPHPCIGGVTVKVERSGSGFQCRYFVEVTLAALIWETGPPGRANELWRHTCFELFVKGEGDGYLEYNFAPSLQWAAYRFDRYREGMRDAGIEPVLAVDMEDGRLVLSAEVDLADMPVVAIGLSAVIETRDGTKSYWALAHPPGKPDFHHPDCFVLELPAAGEP